MYESFDLGRIKMYVSDDHRFGTDAFLLAKYANVRRDSVVVDLCTGCGIIPLIFCKNTPPAKIYAIEIQEEAIDLLKTTIAENNLESVISPILCDLRELSQDRITFECAERLTVRPPSIRHGSGAGPPAARAAKPRQELMCNINDVCKAAARLLKYGGLLKMCHRPERLADVICAMRESGIEPKQLTFVQNTAREKPWLILVSGKKGAASGMVIEKPFVLRNDDLTYTEEYSKIYE